MIIKIDAKATKLLCKVPIKGEVRIDLPLGFIIDKIIIKKILNMLLRLSDKGIVLSGIISFNDDVYKF